MPKMSRGMVTFNNKNSKLSFLNIAFITSVKIFTHMQDGPDFEQERNAEPDCIQLEMK